MLQSGATEESGALLAIDLFSGCGGLTEGLRQAGFRVIGAVDNDSLAVETYKDNHRDVFVWERDIQHLSTSEVMERFEIDCGELDLLAGCPPCQGFSAMRTLNGSRKIDDSRNDLVFEFLRFARELLPKAVMMENVPGLAADPRMTEFWKELQKLGYAGEQRVLDAAQYGVPQRRRRMILLAGRYGPPPFATTATRARNVKWAIGWLPPAGLSGDNLHDLPPARRSDRIQTLIRNIPKNGGSRNDLGAARQLPCHQKCDGFKDVYGRMSWEKVAPTITSGCYNPSKGRFLHPEEDRPITLREAALLQSFPYRYSFSLRRGKSHAAELMGNALPPEFIRRHAGALRQYLQKTIPDQSRTEERERLCRKLKTFSKPI